MCWGEICWFVEVNQKLLLSSAVSNQLIFQETHVSFKTQIEIRASEKNPSVKICLLSEQQKLLSFRLSEQQNRNLLDWTKMQIEIFSIKSPVLNNCSLFTRVRQLGIQNGEECKDRSIRDIVSFMKSWYSLTGERWDEMTLSNIWGSWKDKIVASSYFLQLHQWVIIMRCLNTCVYVWFRHLCRTGVVIRAHSLSIWFSLMIICEDDAHRNR